MQERDKLSSADFSYLGCERTLSEDQREALQDLHELYHHAFSFGMRTALRVNRITAISQAVKASEKVKELGISSQIIEQVKTLAMVEALAGLIEHRLNQVEQTI